MTFQLSTAGAADGSLTRKTHQWWRQAAKDSQIDLTGFDPNAPLSQRLAWAQKANLDVATILSRYSSKLQHSTESQVQENIIFAARHRMYVPPEYVNVDEAQKGRRQRRDGLDRLKSILQKKLARILLVFKVSRLMRAGYKGFQFIQENVVEEGLRAISVSQGIDTDDEKTWKSLMYLHGMMDDLLLDAIADHCRAGLNSLFLEGYVVGALTVGYMRVEVPDAPRTKRGLPRTRPAVDENVRQLIVRHYQWIRDGMPINEGLRRWVEEGGPCDPRSTVGRMTYSAYRRLLSNRRYTGLWAFGRMRNRWSTKRDYTQQVEQPETEVKIVDCKELQIIGDELYFAVQNRLNGLKKGPHGPRKNKPLHLWDLTTGLFNCAHCSRPDDPVRYYQTGAHGKGMQCKHGDLCPCKSAVRRKEAVRAVCEKLQELIQRDKDLIQQVVGRAKEMDARGDDELVAGISKREKKIRSLATRIDDLCELAGQGTDADRAEMKAKIRAAQSERTAHELELTKLRGAVEQSSKQITSNDVEKILANFTSLLENAAAGKLGEDAVYKALSIFEQLVGECIFVHVEPRPARKQTNVRGVFRPYLIRAIRAAAGLHATGQDEISEEAEVWLRKPPMRDLWAQRVHEAIDLEDLSFRCAAAVLQEEGLKGNSGVVYQIYHRYYEMIGQTPPDRPYNNGRPRKSK